MNLERTDIAMYVYNVAAVMSGGYLAMTFEIEDPLIMGGLAIGAGLLWSVYYRWSMAPRLEAMRQGVFIPEDEEFLDDQDDEQSESNESNEEDEEQQGTKPPWEA